MKLIENANQGFIAEHLNHLKKRRIIIVYYFDFNINQPNN